MVKNYVETQKQQKTSKTQSCRAVVDAMNK